MKRFLCHLAQRSPHPTGPLAKHLSRCQECREFFQQVSALESRLVTDAGEPDPHLCAGILASISSAKPAIVTAPKRPWFSSPLALSTAAAFTLLLIGFLMILNFKKPTQVAAGPDQQGDVPPTPAPEESPKMTLAYAEQQQALLQKDVLKLGAHLRENLILFRTGDWKPKN